MSETNLDGGAPGWVEGALPGLASEPTGDECVSRRRMASPLSRQAVGKVPTRDTMIPKNRRCHSIYGDRIVSRSRLSASSSEGSGFVFGTDPTVVSCPDGV